MPSPNVIGVRKPTIDDGADIPRDVGYVVDDFTPQVVPRFGSTGARDAAFTAGQFRLATVGNVLYMRRGSTWTTMLAAEDIDTGWIVATMQGTWSALVSSPASYRISGGMVQWKGVAYRSDDVPSTSGMISVPSNAVPVGANTGTTWQQNVHTKKVVAASLADTALYQDAILNLRKTGSLVCIVPGGTTAGIKIVPLWDLQWALT